MAQIRISGMCALWPWPWSYDLVSRHEPPLSHGLQLCDILSRSNLAVNSYGPDMDFVYKCTMTLALEIWPWVKVMTHPWVMDNTCVKYYKDPTWQWGVMAWHGFWVCVHCDLDLGGMTWVKVMTHPSVIDNNCEKYCLDLTWQWRVMARTHILLYVHFDLDLGGMTLGQVHDTPLGHGQQLCEILSRSNLTVRSYGPDTDFRYLCTVTLTLEVWPWIKVMTHPWVMDNNCVKYYPDRTRG